MQAAAKTAKNPESGSRSAGKPFFDKNGKDSFFSSKSRSEERFFPMLQTRLKIGEPGDKYEKEADAVASSVVQKMAQEKAETSVHAGKKEIQRKCTDCATEEKVSRKEKPKGGQDQDLHRKAAGIAPFTAIHRTSDLPEKAKADEKESVKRKLAKEEKPAIHKLKDRSPEEKVARKADAEKEVKRSIKSADEKRQKKTSDSTAAPMDGLEEKLNAGKGSGSVLPARIRSGMETSMGADLSGVRIHTGSKAAEMSESVNAQAFTYGQNIYFNQGKYNPDSTEGQHLLAHELTHTLQQEGGVQRKIKPGANSGFAVPQTPFHPSGHSGMPHIQRDLLNDAWNATGGQLVDAAGEVLEFSETLFWEVVEKIGGSSLTATLREIQNTGVAEFFKNKLLGAVDTIFDGLQNNSGVIALVFPKFGELLNRAQVIINALAQGDCQPLFAALEELKGIVTEMAGEAWDAITEFFQPAIDFFTEVWNSIALPAIEWLKNKAAAIWEGIKQLAAFIWKGFSPIRDAVSAAWDWLQRMLGQNADETGEEGLIQWAQRKVEAVWEEIKELVRPVIEPARQLVTRIASFIPLGAILNLRQTIQDWLAKVVATSAAMGGDASNIGNEAAQTSLRNQILPAVQASIQDLKGSISEASAWVNGQVGDIYNAVTAFFSTVRNIPLLGMAGSAIEWLETKAAEFKDWCQTQVTALFDVLQSGLTYLSGFLTPIYDALHKIFSALGDLLGKLPEFLLGPVWAILPDCIKEPVKKFFIEQILGRLSFFQKLKQAENIWERIENMAIVALKQVFIDGDLGKAIWTFYSTMLDIIGIPPQLVTRVIAKAAQSLSAIMADPLGFLGHFISALKLGFEQFFNRLGTHLLGGLQAWLLSKLEGTGIEMPKDFSFMSMLKLAFQILGITVDMLLKQLEEVTGKEGLKQKIENYIGVISDAWEWFQKLMNQGPEGGSVWDKLEAAVGSIWDMVLDGIIGWLEETIVVKALAWIAQKLDPTGIMAVITTVIDVFVVFQAVVEKAREILEMIERVLDNIGALIIGIIDQAAVVLETAIASAIPVAMAIMSSLFGLNGVVDKVKEVIQELRQKVENGVRKVMEKIKSWIEKLFGKEEKEGADSITSALREIEEEGEKEEDEGGITEDEAKTIKDKVNQDHASVIEISSVADGGETWDYDYIQKKSKKIPKTPVPESTAAEWKEPYAGEFGTAMNIEILSVKPGPNKGSKPPATGSASDFWKILVMRRNMENRSFYVQGHLLNDNLGGPGANYNLAPITQGANSEHHRQIEKKIKAGVAQGQVYTYTVWAEYGRATNTKLLGLIDKEIKGLSGQANDPATAGELARLKLVRLIVESEKYIPKALFFTASKLKLKDGKWVKDSSIGQDGIHVDIDDKNVENAEDLKDRYL
ncbi:eCIS core domain-containing protein [Dyadobacter sediminis]|uniref:DUF4157 domain-containing protein n=1 Tax=Dyadobacter sediminis TaxID=1493691 RepID=A0A5R9KK57_9BACT|nr:DUF4157 domain-containing protein [Dyadobacter sediminis]TLU96446.1 DUF4157 domain-containing protein [Dyadobacter sediminis]GGB82289.1 hypothetical protein GCM10011325_07270 [Dyadobacter sediminis]